jgi:hypothetical protein
LIHRHQVHRQVLQLVQVHHTFLDTMKWLQLKSLPLHQRHNLKQWGMNSLLSRLWRRLYQLQ